MSEQCQQTKVMVIDGIDASSIAKVLADNGIDCEIVGDEEVQAIQHHEEIPKFTELTIPEMKFLNAETDCWWQQYSGYSKKNKRR